MGRAHRRDRGDGRRCRPDDARHLALLLSGLLACASPAAGPPDASGARDAAVRVDARADDAAPDAAADAARDTIDAAEAPDVTAIEDDGGEELDSGVYTGPLRLSETGLYRDMARRALADGVVTYDVRWPLWADGADKARYLWLPPGTRVDAADLDRWRFPVGTKAWKAFTVDGRTIETRLLEKTDEGWRMAAYVWDELEAEAFARPQGVPNARGTEHDVPSSDNCFGCHRGAADGLIGVATLQLDALSLDALVARGLLDAIPADRTVVPGDGVVRDVLGYLNGNCGYCHNDIHPLSRFERLRLALPVGVATPERTPVYTTAIRAPTRHLIAGTQIAIVPGAPEQSQLFARMRALTAEERMPPLASEIPDDAATSSVAIWIRALP